MLAILIGISSHASPAMVRHISLPVSFDVPATSITSSASALPIISFSASIFSASILASSAPTVVRHSSPEPTIASHRSSAPEPVASYTSFRGPIIALLRERHVRRVAEFAELNKAFFVCEDRVLKLKPSLSTVTCTEAMLRSQVVTLQTDLSIARDSLITAR